MVGSRLFAPWLVLAAVCCVLMVRFPGDETIPFHAAWVALAVAYGLEPWPLRRTYAGVAAMTVVSGGILVARAVSGVIAWDELAEIPLMGLLVAAFVWHVRRRYDATEALRSVGERDRLRAAQRERLSRMTSHEMRTPTTIAVGYLDLLLACEDDPSKRADIGVVLEELDRVRLGTERLVRMLSVPDLEGVEKVDIDATLADILERWRVVADRDWQLDSTSGVQDALPSRIRTCVDTLLENAVRYTGPGDVVRLVSFVQDGMLHVGVEDSGPGFDPEVASAVNQSQWREGGGNVEPLDPKRLTGLGLGIVQETVSIRGGRIHVGRSPEGGARVLLSAQVPTTGSKAPGSSKSLVAGG